MKGGKGSKRSRGPSGNGPKNNVKMIMGDSTQEVIAGMAMAVTKVASTNGGKKQKQTKKDKGVQG